MCVPGPGRYFDADPSSVPGRAIGGRVEGVGIVAMLGVRRRRVYGMTSNELRRLCSALPVGLLYVDFPVRGGVEDGTREAVVFPILRCSAYW